MVERSAGFWKCRAASCTKRRAQGVRLYSFTLKSPIIACGMISSIYSRRPTASFAMTRADLAKPPAKTVEFSNRADLRALLDHLGIDKAVLMGCSRGGQIATDTTLEAPEQVAALITVGSGPGGFEGDISDEETIFAEMEAAEEAGDWKK